MAVRADQYQLADLRRLFDASGEDVVQAIHEDGLFAAVDDALAKADKHEIRRLQRSLGMLGKGQRQIADAGHALALLDRAGTQGYRRVEDQKNDADQERGQ